MNVGDGIIDHLVGAFKALTIGVRQHATKRFAEWLEKVGSQPMTRLVVARKPVLKGVQWALNALSLGRYQQARSRLGYDDVYHNFLLVSFRDGSTWKVEKNHVIEHFQPTPFDAQQRMGHIPTTVGDSFATLVERASARDPRAFWLYDARSTNCQDFTTRIAQATGQPITDLYARELLTPQDADSLVRSLGQLSYLPKRITDLAGLLDRVKGGDGIIDEKVSSTTIKMSSYTPYPLGLSATQVARLNSGVGVRLKHSDLTGSVAIPLTKSQINRIEKAKASGKGLVLKLSATQLAKGGDGILDSMAQYAPMAGDLASSLLSQFAPKGVSAVKNLVDNSSAIPDALKPFLDMGISLGAKHGQEQLSALLKGLSGSKNGKGLFPPGYSLALPGRRGLGLYAPGH